MKEFGCAIVIVMLVVSSCANDETMDMKAKDVEEVSVVPLRDVSFLKDCINCHLWQNEAVMGGHVYLKGIMNDTLYFISQHDSLAYSIKNLREFFTLESPEVSSFQLLPDTSLLVLIRRAEIWMKWNLPGDSLMKTYAFHNLTSDSVKDITSSMLRPFTLNGDTMIIAANQDFDKSKAAKVNLYSNPQIGVLIRTDTSFNLVNKFGVYPHKYREEYGFPLINWQKLSKNTFLLSHFWSPKVFIVDIRDNRVIDSFELAPSYPGSEIKSEQKKFSEKKQAALRARANTTYLAVQSLGDSNYVRLVRFPQEEQRLHDLLIYNHEFDLADRVRLPQGYWNIFAHSGKIYLLKVYEGQMTISMLNI